MATENRNPMDKNNPNEKKNPAQNDTRNAGNFAQDRDRASEAGKKGGEQGHGQQNPKC